MSQRPGAPHGPLSLAVCSQCSERQALSSLPIGQRLGRSQPLPRLQCHGPGPEGRPTSHAGPPARCHQEEARLLWRLSTEVQLAEPSVGPLQGHQARQEAKSPGRSQKQAQRNGAHQGAQSRQESFNGDDVSPDVAPPSLSPALRLAESHETPTDVAGVLSSVPDAPEMTSEVELHSPSEPDLDPDKEPEKDAETEEEKARRLLYCSLCKVAVNSASQLEAHNSGTKHKTMLEARSGVGSIKSFPRPGVKGKVAPPSASKASTGLQNKTFYCETCDVHVNSETQLKQHISSRRHKDRAAGKPAKPKYTPYSKGATKQTQIKLTLGKEHQCPSLATLLPAQLMAAAAAALGNTFPQRAGHAPSPGLFPTPPLLRPAPGPIRTAHPQVLFAPY
ncbi:zinc finger protein 385D isoform X4 [Syngnathus typhle]|uniref:zinc finger protein 385D isoform X4 n=1 Tax=Syngnathus typhle TaxID=161592 RepID=UPI002A698A7F|nr:zinc finger protein 385D isoform X4 [Syngnathus typhle]XP_061145362.1 zinc finger protein 385D isoform X4 [Syngnathus typhle]